LVVIASRSLLTFRRALARAGQAKGIAIVLKEPNSKNSRAHVPEIRPALVSLIHPFEAANNAKGATAPNKTALTNHPRK
jgi:hypothetical protein